MLTKFARLGLALDRGRLLPRRQLARNIASLWLAQRLGRGGEPAIRAGRVRLVGPSVPLMKLLHREVFLNEDYDLPLGTDAPCIIDCGANIGIATAFFKLRHPGARVLAFEPDPSAFGFLTRNTACFGDSVTRRNVALGDSDGPTARFYSQPGNLVLGSVREERGGAADAIDVPAERLSRSIVGPVDLVKMDVEGAEADILEDLVRTKAVLSVRHLLIEYHHNLDRTLNVRFRDLLSAVEALGFACRFGEATGGVRTAGGDFQDVMVHLYRK